MITSRCQFQGFEAGGCSGPPECSLPGNPVLPPGSVCFWLQDSPGTLLTDSCHVFTPFTIGYMFERRVTHPLAICSCMHDFPRVHSHGYKDKPLSPNKRLGLWYSEDGCSTLSIFHFCLGANSLHLPRALRVTSKNVSRSEDEFDKSLRK